MPVEPDDSGSVRPVACSNRAASAFIGVAKLAATAMCAVSAAAGKLADADSTRMDASFLNTRVMTVPWVRCLFRYIQYVISNGERTSDAFPRRVTATRAAPVAWLRLLSCRGGAIRTRP